MDRYARGGFNVGYEARVDVRQPRAKRIAEAHKECPQLIRGKTAALNGALLIEGHDPILFARVASDTASIALLCRGSRKYTPSRLSRKRPSSAAL